jgi:hypothetical protein
VRVLSGDLREPARSWYPGFVGFSVELHGLYRRGEVVGCRVRLYLIPDCDILTGRRRLLEFRYREGFLTDDRAMLEAARRLHLVRRTI